MIYLFSPIWQAIVGVAAVVAVVLAVLGHRQLLGRQLVRARLLLHAGLRRDDLGCVSARRGEGASGWVMGFLVAQAYAFYTWLLWPVLVRSTSGS